MKSVVFSLLALLLAAQAGKSSEAPASPLSLASRIAALEKALEKERLERVFHATFFEHRELDCVSHGTTIIQEKNGLLGFYVGCDNIEPYLEGYRVRLRIGNPYAAEFGNTSLMLFHGKDVEESFRDSNQVKVDIPNRLPAGSWVPIVITVSRAKVEQMRHLALELTVGAVKLNDTRSGPQ